MGVRHLVQLALKENTAANVKQALEKLSASMQGLINFYFGPCSGNDPYNYYFFMDFDTSENRDKYLNHADHIKVAQENVIPNLKADPLEAVMVFDYEKSNVTKKTYEQNNSTGRNILFLLKDENTVPELAGKEIVNQSQEPFAKASRKAIKFKQTADTPSVVAAHSRLFSIAHKKVSDLGQSSSATSPSCTKP